MTPAHTAIRFSQRLNQVFHDLFAQDERIVLIGEDLLDPYGGAFKISKGLSTKYPDRVLTTPISEGAIVGLGAGLAMRGMRPIIEIMFGDFTTLGFDQIVNGISKYPSMYNDQITCPVIIRTPMGGRRGYGPTHSQTLDKYLIAVPNLRVLAPSVLHDLGSLYREALEDPMPKFIIENKLMYGENMAETVAGKMREFSLRMSEDKYPVASLSIENFSRADLTLVAYGGMVSLALKAAEQLYLEEEYVVEVLVPSQLAPLDCGFVCESLTRSGRLLTIEEGTETCGFSAELGFQAQNRFWDLLKAPVTRVTAPNEIIPSSKILEAQMLPDEQQIIQAALDLIR